MKGTWYCIYEVIVSSYGTVFKARYIKKNRFVAIKIVNEIQDREDITKEINILKDCKSDYIIRYYGSYYKDDNLWVCWFLKEMISRLLWNLEILVH